MRKILITTIAIMASIITAPPASAASIPGTSFRATQATCAGPATITITNTRSSSAQYSGRITVAGASVVFRLSVGTQSHTYTIVSPSNYAVVVNRSGLGSQTYLSGTFIPPYCG